MNVEAYFQYWGTCSTPHNLSLITLLFCKDVPCVCIYIYFIILHNYFIYFIMRHSTLDVFSVFFEGGLKIFVINILLWHKFQIL